MLSIGETIKEKRKFLGMTQADLSEKIGISIVTLRRYEKDEVLPSAQMLQKIANALDLTETQFKFAMSEGRDKESTSLFHDSYDWNIMSKKEFEIFQELDDEMLILLYRIYGNVQRKTVHSDHAPPNIPNEESYYAVGKKGKIFYLLEDDIDTIRYYVEKEVKRVVYLIQKNKPDTEDELRQWLLYEMEGKETIDNAYRTMEELQKRERNQGIKPLEEIIKNDLEEYFEKLGRGNVKTIKAFSTSGNQND